MKNVLKKAWRFFLDLLFPPRCGVCEQIVVIGRELCPDCAKCLSERDNIITCVSCRNEAHACTCTQDEAILCASPFRYDGGMRRIILAFKFGKKQTIAPLLVGAMADSVRMLYAPAFDFICAVPMSEKRRAERTFNQAELLAEELGAQLKIPYAPLLVKVRENQIQHRLDSAQRKENVRGVYGAINEEMIQGKNILLCDDIITTASTLLECVGMLKAAGAKQVFCVTAGAR